MNGPLGDGILEHLVHGIASDLNDTYGVREGQHRLDVEEFDRAFLDHLVQSNGATSHHSKVCFILSREQVSEEVADVGLFSAQLFKETCQFNVGVPALESHALLEASHVVGHVDHDLFVGLAVFLRQGVPLNKGLQLGGGGVKQLFSFVLTFVELMIRLELVELGLADVKLKSDLGVVLKVTATLDHGHDCRQGRL